MTSNSQEQKADVFARMDLLGAERVPFLFIVDFEMQKPMLFPISQLPEHIRFSVPGCPYHGPDTEVRPQIYFERFPMPYDEYRKAFGIVMNHLLMGNSYLVNLTFPTRVRTNLTLPDIFALSKAPYKLLVDKDFVVFSPEPFVIIRDGLIRSFPMKGTIDASVKNAEQKVLEDPKESAEHFTIVDLIRNDLSKVSHEVKVERFRYVSRIRTLNREILQVSSEITGRLDPGYHKHLGRIFKDLLPAGSISGAPKKRTVEIISESEGSRRGYYTGVFGYFDGQNVESAVMIRYIEQAGGEFVFRSGGGITYQSDPEAEYQEMLAKVYLQI